jgi:7,8-dihydropterin-6-yl-methyl-4-(beta-D-ribofuranosyl)aminobenzene 5'-phosphate synthase
MKVTTLIENRSSKTDRRLAAEWGLSLHIEFNGHNILFDTGASGSFAKNAEHLSVSIASVDTAVLSHHHYDHGGGLRKFFELNSSAKVHMGDIPDGECFGKLGIVKKYIGLDKTVIADFEDRFKIVKNPAEILPDVFIFPHIIDEHPKPAGNKHLFLRKNHSFTLDDFTHEIVMAIKEKGKLIIFTGCSHNGILNMVDTVSQEFKGYPLKQ